MTKIQWTNKTWSPVTGCTKISTGCRSCYAKTMHKRLNAMGQVKYQKPFSEIVCHEHELNRNFGKKPKRIFVCSMSDLFHSDVDFSFIIDVFHVIKDNPQHIFQILTKRPDIMYEFMTDYIPNPYGEPYEPLNNLWLRVSCENQEQADKRIPVLLQIPAAVRFVSIEPLINKIVFNKGLLNNIDWCIIGAENAGKKSRPMKNEWVERIIEQCEKTNTSIFYKQQRVNGKMISKPTINGKQYLQFPKVTN